MLFYSAFLRHGIGQNILLPKTKNYSNGKVLPAYLELATSVLAETNVGRGGRLTGANGVGIGYSLTEGCWWGKQQVGNCKDSS